jgi:hypothetical protein
LLRLRHSFDGPHLDQVIKECIASLAPHGNEGLVGGDGSGRTGSDQGERQNGDTGKRLHASIKPSPQTISNAEEGRS